LKKSGQRVEIKTTAPLAVAGIADPGQEFSRVSEIGITDAGYNSAADIHF